MIVLDKIGYRYQSGPEVLSDLSFELAQGSFHFLTGASGAGKSSLLKLLYLAQRPSRGKLYLFDQDVGKLRRHHLPKLRQRMGVVFQEHRLIPHLTAYENVALPLRIARVNSKRIHRHVTEILEWVGLVNEMHALPVTLSGGEQQRVAIARAVVSQPDILLADEPTGNVDDELAERLLYLFEQLNRQGTTVVIATHAEHMINRFSYPRLHLKQGQLRVMPPMVLPKTLQRVAS
jgi:cell division transport system ATP-binding protein